MNKKDIIKVSFEAPEITEEDRKTAARLAALPDSEIICDKENPLLSEPVVCYKGLCPPSSKSGRGGARPGSGRKPSPSPLVAKTIRLPQEVWDRLALEGKSYRDSIEKLMEKAARV